MSSEWHTVTVERIASPNASALATGPFGSSISAKYFQPSGVPVIRGSNLSADVSIRLNDEGLVFVSEAKATEFQRSIVSKGDLVFTCWGTINQVGLIDGRSKYERYVISNKQMKLTVDPLKADSRFIYYVFSGPDKQAEILDNGIGSSVPGFNLGQLRRHEFLLPPLIEQKAIADFLNYLDERITLLRETNATLEAIAQALFKSWFVDFDPVRAKQQGREPEGMDEATAALFPDGFDESELGLVPRGWRVASVGDVVNVTDYVANGSFAALKKNVTLRDGPSYALYVRTTDYNSGFSGGYRYVDKSAYDFLSKSSLDGSEVIISNVGDVGTVFRPPRWLGLPMTLGSNAVALKKPEMSAYLYFHFSGPLGQHNIQSIVTGSAQLKFNKTNFRALRLLMPDGKCLAYFEEVANSLLSRIEVNLAQAQTLATLRDTLLPRLISGQLRLPEVEALIEDVA